LINDYSLIFSHEGFFEGEPFFIFKSAKVRFLKLKLKEFLLGFLWA